MLRPAIELWKWRRQSMGRCTRRSYAIDDQERWVFVVVCEYAPPASECAFTSPEKTLQAARLGIM